MECKKKKRKYSKLMDTKKRLYIKRKNESFKERIPFYISSENEDVGILKHYNL